jgi:glutaminyl-tRNA synthetase
MTNSSDKKCLIFPFLPSFLRFIPNCSIETILCPITKQPYDNVIIVFIDESFVETTDCNALRSVLNHGKLLIPSKKFSSLTLQEKVHVEELLLQCNLLKNPNDLLQLFNKSLKFTKNNVPFLIQENTLTCVDLLFYYRLNEKDNTIETPQLHHWLTTLNNFLETLNDDNSSHETAFQTSGQKNFIRTIIENDLKQGKHKTIVTRFPPEPNGFLHLGHAKSICLNFGLAKDFGGVCHLRFDDTNPTKENLDYIEAIQKDVQWLGGNYGHHLYYTSDYFDQLYEWAIDLIKKELAYVDDQTEEELKKNRGDLFTPGINSIYRNRSVEENLQLFSRMKNGEFPEGKCVLRAKIDMSHGNPTMRDPILYRIRYHSHPRTQNKWCIYPMYDFAHGQSDSIERITHSLCTLEFEDRRPLYNWFQEKLNIFRTCQIEFARLNCTYTVMSKRYITYF